MRKLALILGLVAGVMASAPNVQAAIIRVDYNFTGAVFAPAPVGQAGTFSGSAAIVYNGAGLATLSHGPVNLISGNRTIITNTNIFGVALLTGLNTSTGVGPGNLASNGLLTLMQTSVNTGGFIHCYNPIPKTDGCGLFLKLPASTPFPQTGGISSQLLQGNLGVGPVPANFTLMGVAVGGNATTSTWNFVETARTIVPEPATGSLLGLGVLGLAMAGGSLKARRRS